MTLVDLFLRDAAGPTDLSSAPPDSQAAWMRRKAEELVEATARLSRAEALVEQIKKRKHELESKTLPDIMDAIGTDTIGLPRSGVDVVVRPYAHLSISQDWEPEKREAAFDELEKHGGGDLVKGTITVSFPKDDLARMTRCAAALTAWLAKVYANEQPPPVTATKTAHHGALASWLKALMTERQEKMADHIPVEPLDLDRLGGTIGRVCKIVKRKENKPKQTRRRK